MANNQLLLLSLKTHENYKFHSSIEHKVYFKSYKIVFYNLKRPNILTYCNLIKEISAGKSYLFLSFLRKLPIVGFQLVELIKLHAYIFYRKLEQIPEPCEVLCCWSWVGIYVLIKETDTKLILNKKCLQVND